MKLTILKQLISASALVSLAASSAQALDIDFKDGDWTHPNGPSVGWNSSQSTGVTTLPDGSTATVTVSFAGAASPTADNLKNIDESFYVGFAFQQWEEGARNATSLTNYMRVDFQFSTEVSFENFVINDIDVKEVIQVEGWAQSPGTPASGMPAIYAPGEKLEPYTLGGITGVTTKVSGNTTLDPASKVGVSFATPVKAVSVYYSKQVTSESPFITTGIEGNLIVVHTQPPGPQLYYTYNLANEEDVPITVAFTDTLPAGYLWDKSYTPVMTGGLTPEVVYSNGDTTASVASMTLPPGACTLTLKTKDVAMSGTVDNEATITPSAESGLGEMIANASVTWDGIPLPLFAGDFADSGLSDYSWLVFGDGASVLGSSNTVSGRVGVGPGATLEFDTTAIAPSQIVADPNATLIGGTAGTSADLAALKAQALALNLEALAMTPTQSYATISGATTINGTVQNGWNVIAAESIKLSATDEVLTIEGDADDYFIINVENGIDMSGTASFVLGAAINPSHVIINVKPGTVANFVGQSLKIGATILAPAAHVKMAGGTELTGTIVSGGVRDSFEGTWGSKLTGTAMLIGTTQ